MKNEHTSKRIITIWLWSGIWKVALSITATAALSFGLLVVLIPDTTGVEALGLLMGMLAGVIATHIAIRIWPCWRFEWR